MLRQRVSLLSRVAAASHAAGGPLHDKPLHRPFLQLLPAALLSPYLMHPQLHALFVLQ
jgi:hypothetical protein